MLRRWRRLDQAGLELARIDLKDHGVTVSSNLVDGGEKPFALRYIWTLDRDWSTRTLRMEHMDGDDRWMTIERAGDASWRIDNRAAPHLDGCPELDLSASPFSNSLAIRHLAGDAEFDAAYISADALTVTRSRQRYEAIDDRTWRYIDLGVAHGFEAELRFDADGLIETYEGLFEALA
jgi:hypothetical protein